MGNPFDPGYFDEHALAEVNFKALGRNVSIAKNCTIIGVENISIGDNVRIDGYTLLTAAGEGFLTIGSFIHIAGFCSVAGGAGVVMEDFSGISQGVRIYSRSDDYSGEHLTNPSVPPEYTGVVSGTVVLGRHVIVGAQSVILPNVVIGEGSSVGALSLVTRSLEPWGVYAGCPVRRLGDRSRRLLRLESELLRRSAVDGGAA